nr:hypothetical protein Iba_chr09cCG14410 [Ipomoea batatas]
MSSKRTAAAESLAFFTLGIASPMHSSIHPLSEVFTRLLLVVGTVLAVLELDALEVFLDGRKRHLKKLPEKILNLLFKSTRSMTKVYVKAMFNSNTCKVFIIHSSSSQGMKIQAKEVNRKGKVVGATWMQGDASPWGHFYSVPLPLSGKSISVNAPISWSFLQASKQTAYTQHSNASVETKLEAPLRWLMSVLSMASFRNVSSLFLAFLRKVSCDKFPLNKICVKTSYKRIAMKCFPAPVSRKAIVIFSALPVQGTSILMIKLGILKAQEFRMSQNMIQSSPKNKDQAPLIGRFWEAKVEWHGEQLTYSWRKSSQGMSEA